jgi:O-antigen/teichoic acid export membrane protein
MEASDSPVPAAPPNLARRTFLGFRADVISGVSQLLASVIAARGLGPGDRGVFFLVFFAATLIAIAGDLGVSTTSIVFGANREIPSRQLHGIAATLAAAVALLAAAILLPLESFWTGEVLRGLDTGLLVMLCVGVFVVLYSQVLVALLTGMGHIPEVSALRLAQAVLYVVLLTPAAFAGNAKWAVAAWLATATLYAAGLGLQALRLSGRPQLPPAHTIRQVVSFGGRSYVGTISYQGFLRIDVLFLSARYGPATVGIYSLAAVFAERIGLVGHAMYGATAESVGQGGAEAARLTALTTRMMLTMLIPIGAVLAALSFPGFPLVFGDAFSDAALPFVILLPGTIALICWHFMSLYIVSALRRPGTTTLIQGAALIVSLPLYWLAVKQWDMTGAAAVSAATYIAVFAAGTAVFLRNSGVGFRALIPGREEPGRIFTSLRAGLSR